MDGSGILWFDSSHVFTIYERWRKKSPAKVEATWEICNLNLWMAQAYYGLRVSVVVTLRVVDCEEISESPNF
jgi:hypothetical protein